MNIETMVQDGWPRKIVRKDNQVWELVKPYKFSNGEIGGVYKCLNIGKNEELNNCMIWKGENENDTCHE